jgi:N-acetylmuramoyl-L-alanine amidase
MRPVGKGDRGKQVVDIQTRLAGLGFLLGQEGADGLFGPHTEIAIREFQQQRLLLVDGRVGDNTWMELVEAGHHPGDRLLYLRVPCMRGDDVLYLQRRLDELGFDCGPIDGIFSPALEEAVNEFQRNAGLNVDGIVGESTIDHLRRLQKVQPDGFASTIPDRLNGYVDVTCLDGLRVSVDPAHGGPETGPKGVTGVYEKELNLRLGQSLAAQLRAAGALVYLLRDDDWAFGLYERAEMASAWGPHVHLCLHHNHCADPRAEGAAVYYFANRFYISEAGRRLAGYIVGSLTAELERVDLHKHGRNYACLREVQPLSVMIEPGFMSHPEEGRSIADDDTIDREARAILRGIEHYLARR